VEQSYAREEDWLVAVNDLLGSYLPTRSAKVLEQFRNGWIYPRIEPPTFSQRGGPIAAGFHLAMSAEAGTVYYTVDGSDPREPSGASLARRQFVLNSGLKRYFIPTSDALGDAWVRDIPAFDDSGWATGAGSIGYSLTFSFPSTDVRADMRGRSPSLYLRVPFVAGSEDISDLAELTLRMRCFDGYVAYLNGVKIAAVNAPDNPNWASAASLIRSHGPLSEESFSIANPATVLHAGTNVLAIHALAASISATLFIVEADLIGVRTPFRGTLRSTARRYESPLALLGNTAVKAAVLKNGQWSALTEGTFIVAKPQLSISEIHYHPAAPTEAERKPGFTDPDDFEFIEVVNSGAAAIQLAGARFAAGIVFEFPAADSFSLMPGATVLLVKSRAAFRARYGPIPIIHGEYSGKLANEGETIRVVDKANQTLAEVTYDDSSPWPASSDGAGPSLERLDFGGDPNTPNSWRASSQMGGSPGAWSGPKPSFKSVTVSQGLVRLQFVARGGQSYTVYQFDKIGEAERRVFQKISSSPAERIVEVQDLVPAVRERYYLLSTP
jgi:hypothetical protein